MAQPNISLLHEVIGKTKKNKKGQEKEPKKNNGKSKKIIP
jgi:hypothetical protein